jgi:hypothetical protein
VIRFSRFARFSQTPQVADRARESRPRLIGYIELVPARDVAADAASEQELDCNAKPFDEAGRAEHVLRDGERTIALLRPELLEPADAMARAVEHRAAEQAIEP